MVVSDEVMELDTSLRRKESNATVVIVILCVAIVFVYMACLFIGQSSMTSKDVIDTILGNGSWGHNYIVFNLRMPRTLCAAIVGAGLSIAGVAMQAMFKNPMASPSVLGLSSGASFGACLAIAFGIGGMFGRYTTPVMAFLFCLLTMFLVYSLAITRYGVPITLLLLSGIAVGAFFSGLTSLIQYVVDPDVLQGVIYWTLGSFNRCSWTSFYVGIPIIGAGVVLICLCIKELNLLALGDEQAESLGVNLRRTRSMILVGTSLSVGGAVAISGVIGFVGLIIPHMCRVICGPNHKLLAPLSILVGAIFMMIMDAISKCGIFYGELPVGILTALLGAPFFIYIMRKKKNEIWG